MATNSKRVREEIQDERIKLGQSFVIGMAANKFNLKVIGTSNDISTQVKPVTAYISILNQHSGNWIFRQLDISHPIAPVTMDPFEDLYEPYRKSIHQ